MAGHEPGTFGSSSMTPPTEIGYAPVPPAQSSWPTVIGIIAIVVGAARVLLGCSGVLSPLFMKAMAQAMPAGPNMAPLAVASKYTPLTIALSVGAMGLAALLLAAGIGLLKRTAWALRATIVWAVAKTLFVVGQITCNYFIQQEVLAALASDPQTANMPAGLTAAIRALSLVGGLLWGWALPIFMLIWFARGKIRAEVAAWGGGRVRCPNPTCQALNQADAEYCAKCGTRLPGGMA